MCDDAASSQSFGRTKQVLSPSVYKTPGRSLQTVAVPKLDRLFTVAVGLQALATCKLRATFRRCPSPPFSSQRMQMFRHLKELQLITVVTGALTLLLFLAEVAADGVVK